MKAVVGLGNPGEKYEHTRHNAGFDVLEVLAQKLSVPVRELGQKALKGTANVDGTRLLLVKPQTFMNLSGEAVRAISDYYKIEPPDMLVIVDDIDLPFGRIRVRASGGPGTHNGLRSIVQYLGRDDFPRVRLGMGGAPEGWELADYVLSRFATPEERKIAFDMYLRAADCALTFAREGIERAMLNFNHA